MKKQKLYLSTVDEKAEVLAGENGLGLEFAEFCTAWNLDDEFPQTDASIRKKMKFTDRYTIHGPYNELFPCAIDKKARQLAAYRYRQTIRTAQAYGISKIVLHAGHNPWLYYPIWFQEQSVVFWKEFAREIPEDITICLENVLEEKPEMIAEILRQVDSPRLRMTLDVGHANAYSKISPLEWIDRCADVISHFHVHNNDGTADTHSALTEGTIPMETLLERIEEKCPRATVTLELPDAASSVEWLLERHILEE